MDRNRRIGLILATLGVLLLGTGLYLIFAAEAASPTSAAIGWESVFSLLTLGLGGILLTFGSIGITVGDSKKRFART